MGSMNPEDGGGGVREQLAVIEPLPPRLYTDIDLNRLLVFAIGWLRERNLPLIFEYITVVSFRLFPLKFELRGFSYPDSNRVNRGLLQLGPKYRNWARGKPSTGYALTNGGEKVLAQISSLIEERKAGGSEREQVVEPETQEEPGYTLSPEMELRELRDSSAFAAFLREGGEALRIDDVWAVVGGFSYTPFDPMKRRLRVLRGIARDAGDDEAETFLRALQKVLKETYARRKS